MKVNDFVITIFSYPADYLKYMFYDASKLENVNYIVDPYLYYAPTKWLKLLYKLLNNKFSRKIFKNQLVKYWKKFLFLNIQKEENNLFIFLMRWLKPENEYIFKSLKQKLPSAKIVIYFEDIVSTGENSLNLNLLKYADLVISYDKDDAMKYGFLYHPTFISNLQSPENANIPEFDICFYGTGKKREEELTLIYRSLTASGYKCDFGIFNSQIKSKEKGINYLRHFIPYKNYLRRIYQSEFILELIQDNCIGYTLRCWEAIALNKKLLTNNKAILNAPFYNRNQFGYFETVDDIPDLIEYMKGKIIDNPYKEKLSSLNFINFVISNI